MSYDPYHQKKGLLPTRCNKERVDIKGGKDTKKEILYQKLKQKITCSDMANITFT